MIRKFEKDILDEIHFLRRYAAATNSHIKNVNSAYSLSKADIKDALKQTGYNYKNYQQQFSTDVEVDDFTFRLLFDVKDDSVLTYIYVLRNGTFLNNGLSHFGYMLTWFDISGVEFDRNFGFNDKSDFLDYIMSMLSIFEDFKTEFLARGGTQLKE